MKHIALIGLSGSGKSSLGEMLARNLGLPFADLDEEAERETGMSIRRMFDLHGERFFRDVETGVTRRITASPMQTVIAPGGGVVLRPENARALKERCVVIFLDRPVGMIARDITYDDRPLLTGAGHLLDQERERRALYLDAADFVLQNDSGPSDALDELMKMLDDFLPKSGTGCAVIGDPITHTLSPVIHMAVFGAMDVSGWYRAVRVPAGELRAFVEMARGSGMRGFNVTIPHKSCIIPLLDETEEGAKLCGAVNTVVIKDGRLSGFNTDMGGLLSSLVSIGFGYAGRNITILGAGGAARGAAFKAALEGAESVAILGRRPEKAHEIASGIRAVSSCRVYPGEMSHREMSHAAGESDILINATPLGMSGAGSDFESLEFLRSLPRGALVCDLVYRPAETNLLRASRDLGYETQNGLGMLIHQALLADELFLERRLDMPALYKIVEGKIAK
ncbi:MAG: shikimate dehydrogenase [Synergistaceae bacterium]|jgi:shikimate dehydrogenase|nr:shikimate dehydrogenase [Synergistaceae bacterium]